MSDILEQSGAAAGHNGHEKTLAISTARPAEDWDQPDAGPTVWIIDDDAEARDELARAAARCSAGVRTYSEPTRFLREFHMEGPGCVVVDAQLADLAGLKLLQELAARYVVTPRIAVLGHAEVGLVVQLMRAGAFDVLQKPIAPELLEQTLRSALLQDHARRKADGVGAEVRQRLNFLTRRERQVLEYIGAGLSSRGIAERMELCERTIEIYRSRIKKKMNTRNAADLVRKLNLAGQAGFKALAPAADAQVGG